MKYNLYKVMKVLCKRLTQMKPFIGLFDFNIRINWSANDMKITSKNQI